MLKRIFAKIHLFFVVIILISIFWFGRGYFFDEAPATDRESFYQSINRHIPDENNLAIAISGLNAPKDGNITVYGRKVTDSLYLPASKSSKKNSSDKVDKLQIIWLEDQHLTDCEQENAIEFRIDECTSPQVASELIDKNKVLLARYIDLHQIPDWQGDSYDENTLILWLNVLLSAQNKLLITHEKFEQAYQQWKNNHLFIQRTLKQELPLGSQSSFEFATGISLKTLENLIFESPETLLSHEEEINGILKSQDIVSKVRSMLRAEYRLLNRLISHQEKKVNSEKSFHVERLRNSIYYFNLDYLQLAKLPAKEYSSHFSELVNKYRTSSDNRIIIFIKYFLPYGSIDRFFNVMYAGNLLLFNGHVEEMHLNNALTSLLKLRNQIYIQNIQRNDIRTFLKSSSKELYCQFTERPMAFDKRNKTLYCEDPNNRERVVKVRLTL